MKSDQILELVRAWRNREDARFRAIVGQISALERGKGREDFARRLEAVGNAGGGVEEIPTAMETRAPLGEIRVPRGRGERELRLGEEAREALGRVEGEWKKWEEIEGAGLRPTSRLVFYGAPGGGKTACAEELALRLGVRLLYVRWDGIVGSLMGSTGSNLRKLFDFAERGNWVIFFDEFDVLGERLGGDGSAASAESRRIVGNFLQILDGFRGKSIVVAATNLEGTIDAAIWRRFDEVLEFGRPGEEAMRSFVAGLLAPWRAPEGAAGELAGGLAGASYADAERACEGVVKRALVAGREIGWGDVESEIQRYRGRARDEE